MGGPAIHTVLLTEGLTARGFVSQLVTGPVGASEGDMGYFAEARKVDVVVVPGLGHAAGPLQSLWAVVRLYRLLRRVRPHIVHTHTTKAGALGRIAALAANGTARLRGEQRAKIVHTFHGHVFDGYFSPLVSGVIVTAERMLAHATDCVIAVSQTMGRELVGRYRICRQDKVRVVSLGLEFDWVSSLDEHTGWFRRRHGIPPNAVLLGIVGRLTRIKNHAALLQAFRRVRHADAWLAVFGDGELRAELEHMARALGVSARVVFAGWEREPARMYADLDLVCLTSRNEGTPVALLEAMAAGRAFVSTQVGGVRDLMVGEPTPHPAEFDLYANGLLVPTDDAEVLAAAIHYLIERPDRRRAMGAVGEAAVLKRFSRQRLMDDMETIYRSLLGSDLEGQCVH